MKLYLVFEHFKGEKFLCEIFTLQSRAAKDALERNAKEEKFRAAGYIGPKPHYQVEEWEIQE